MEGHIFEEILRIFSEFELCKISAVRSGAMERVNEGMVLGFRKGKFKENPRFISSGGTAVILLLLVLKNQPVIIIPIYLNGSADKWEQEWPNMCSLFVFIHNYHYLTKSVI